MARLLAFAIALLLTRSASAAIIINVGDHYLQPNLSGQTIDIYVSRTGTETVSGLNFRAEIGEGAIADINHPPYTGPIFSALSITSPGMVFNSQGTPTIWVSGQYAEGQVLVSGGNIAPDGWLGRLTVDTTGWFGYQTWTLAMSDPLPSSYDGTNFAGTPATITNGTITVVPEPSTFVQLLSVGVLAVGGYFGRKRFAKKKA